jgi:predicted DNA-binding protein
MPHINLSLPTEQLTKATQMASTLGLNRSSYLRRAIEAYNEKIEREILAQKFKEASERCRDESLRVCREFDSIDNIPE